MQNSENKKIKGFFAPQEVRVHDAEHNQMN